MVPEMALGVQDETENFVVHQAVAPITLCESIPRGWQAPSDHLAHVVRTVFSCSLLDSG